ncbi:predicted protein [Postia placenta Mad-698-R]|nr:predicted protein [Postia placenta Mad-698-R]
MTPKRSIPPYVTGFINPRSSGDEMYIFKDDKYVLIHFHTSTLRDTLLSGPHCITDDWVSLKHVGFSCIDAAIPNPSTPNQVFFFFQDRYVLVEVCSKPGAHDDKLIDGPKNTLIEFANLQGPQFGTPDVTLQIAWPADDGYYWVYFFKDTEWLQFKLARTVMARSTWRFPSREATDTRSTSVGHNMQGSGISLAQADAKRFSLRRDMQLASAAWQFIGVPLPVFEVTEALDLLVVFMIQCEGLLYVRFTGFEYDGDEELVVAGSAKDDGVDVDDGVVDEVASRWRRASLEGLSGPLCTMKLDVWRRRDQIVAASTG